MNDNNIYIGYFNNLTQTIDNISWCLIDLYTTDAHILTPFNNNDIIIADKNDKVLELWIPQKIFTFLSLKYQVASYQFYNESDYENHIKILKEKISTRD